MAFKFPFTNYHELNLTWVLDQLKKLFEESAENVSVIETYNGRLTAVETELPTVSENAAEAARSAAAAATLAQTAKATADTAQENAIQAQRTAGTAQNTAERAQEAADAATQAAQQAQATAQNFDGRITQAENDASQALEASRSFENRVQAASTTANNAARTATDAQGVAQNANQNAAAALDKIGDLSQLDTTAKQNLVAAINEAAQSGGGGDCSNCAPLIINNASGAVASFSDGADGLQIKKIIGTIASQQNGRTQATIKQTGKNLYDKQNLVNGYTNANLVFIQDSNARSTDLIPINGQCTFSAKRTNTALSSDSKIRLAIFDENKQILNRVVSNQFGPNEISKITVNDSSVKYVRAELFIGSNTIDTAMVELDTTGSVYQAYQSRTLQVTFTDPATGNPLTIYSGTITINNDGSADIVDSNTGNSYHLTNVGRLLTYYGNNNIWIDTGTITECDYPADTKLYIDGKIAELQALILEN